MHGELTFHDVLEYRWIYQGLIYEDFPEDFIGTVGFGLCEILDSSYKENALSKCMYKGFPGMRLLGLELNEKKLHHYYLFFEGFGGFHILAFKVTKRQYPRTASD
jgi:hypothetical protein